MKLTRTVEPYNVIKTKLTKTIQITIAKGVEETPFFAFIISKFVKNQETKLFMVFLKNQKNQKPKNQAFNSPDCE